MTGETLGAMLRRLRIERGYSQSHLAQLAGCDPSYVNTMERARPGSMKVGITYLLFRPHVHLHSEPGSPTSDYSDKTQPSVS